MQTNPTSVSASTNSSMINSLSDHNKSAFMEFQPPYGSAVAMRTAYSNYMQSPGQEFYNNHPANRAGYAFNPQYASNSTAFTQNFSAVGNIGTYYNPAAASAVSAVREGKSTYAGGINTAYCHKHLQRIVNCLENIMGDILQQVVARFPIQQNLIHGN